MRLGQDVLSDLRGSIAREWLITNGLGGTASASVIGVNTRRSHGLLGAQGADGLRIPLLLRVHARAHVDGVWHHLSSNLHKGPVVRPSGHEMLESFELDPWPIWRLRAGDLRLEQSLFLIEGHDAIVVSFKHVEGPPARIAASPLVVARTDATPETAEAEAAHASQGVPGRVRIEVRDGLPAITLWHNGGFMPARVWVRDLVYPADASEATEDAIVPCHVEATLERGGELNVVLATEDDLFKALAREECLGTPPPRTLRDCVAVLQRERMRAAASWRGTALRGADFTARQATVAHGDPGAATVRQLEPIIARDDPWAPLLADAIYAGLARREGGRATLVSSLPDGVERGSDALRAVGGLIALRRFELARAVLQGYVEYLSEGLAPEAFDLADGTPRYGDPTPSLWLVHAAELYVRRSEDIAFLKDVLFAPLESIVQAFRSGTRYGVRSTSDGLLEIGVSAAQGSAAPGVRPDVNALWYHALVAMAQLAKLVGRREHGAFYLAWARELNQRYAESLWDDARGCLREPSGRTPLASQLLAVSLSPQVLPMRHAARLLETIERDLVTPLGVREQPGGRVSLAWAGPYVTASLRVHGRSAEAQARMRAWLTGLRDAVTRVSCGHVPEAFAPDAPANRPLVHGAPCSIVAASELLRGWIEEIDHSRRPAVAEPTGL